MKILKTRKEGKSCNNRQKNCTNRQMAYILRKAQKEKRSKTKNRENREKVPRHVTPGSLTQSCQSWSSCPVMTLLEHLPSHDKPGGQADKSTSTSGVLLSPKLVTPGAISQ